MLTALEMVPTENRGALLFEIASIQRLQGRFEEAVATYQAALAEDSSGEVTFDAWIGIARAHAYGTKDHGAADEALQQALEAAGPEPSRKHRYELADYLAQLQIARGEIEAALSNALQANRFAATDDERYYAELDTADALQQFAASCDFRQLVDAKTYSDEADDGWGACRRAVGVAGEYYARSAETAARLGWNQMRVMSDEFRSNLSTRLFLIEQRASMSQWADARAFAAEDAADVLVNEEFSTGGEGIDLPQLAAFIGEAVAGAAEGDPRPEFLLAMKADIEGDATGALTHFERAVETLERERASLFDVRQRGTVVENRPELVRSLGLRLIALGSYDRAFAAFESIRARGLGDLAAAYEAEDFSVAERRWLAGLVDLEFAGKCGADRSHRGDHRRSDQRPGPDAGRARGHSHTPERPHQRPGILRHSVAPGGRAARSGRAGGHHQPCEGDRSSRALLLGYPEQRGRVGGEPPGNGSKERLPA